MHQANYEQFRPALNASRLVYAQSGNRPKIVPLHHFYPICMNSIRLADKTFVPYIAEQRLLESISALAERMNRDYEGRHPLFLVVLNGAFLFAADLLREIRIDCEVSFVKLASYHGTSSTGKMKELIGLNESLAGRAVIIVEDIVDTGFTIETLVAKVKEQGAADVKVATLLFKPEAYAKEVPIDYIGLEIPEAFIVGYGLDYNGLGRNLRNIYVVKED